MFSTQGLHHSSRLDLFARLSEIVPPFEDARAVPGHEGPLRVQKPAFRHHLCPLPLGNPRLFQELHVPTGARVRENDTGAEFECERGVAVERV
jgi:hypothetical protein